MTNQSIINSIFVGIIGTVILTLIVIWAVKLYKALKEEQYNRAYPEMD